MTPWGKGGASNFEMVLAAICGLGTVGPYVLSVVVVGLVVGIELSADYPHIRDIKFDFCKLEKEKLPQISPQICLLRMVVFVKVWQSLCFCVGTSTST